MIPSSAVGRTFGPYRGTVDAARLRLFSQVLGESRPEYLDGGAARAAGWADVPAPLTYAFCLQMLDSADPLDWAREIGVEMPRALHGEHQFTYHRPLVAGDDVDFTIRIDEVYDRKDGALTFVVSDIAGRDARGALVVEMRQTLVVKNR